MNLKLFLFFSLFSGLVLSQHQPKVGLVLSGGGAKGFAHIGALKEIERAGIQLDYIGGTSMGAIVGGLYAAGYSATQIEKIIIETDFLKLLRDENPRETKPFFDKEYGENEFVTLPVNKGKIGFPRAISKGQNVLSFLTTLLAPVNTITDFKKLPIPFFCIATDIETGQEVLLEEGSLALALRASGSFPTLLTPIEMEGKLLIDGGVSNNFPVDIMKEKGVDLIIGVDVQGKLGERTKLRSAVDILNQVVSYKMYENSTAQLSLVDVYVHPDIYEYTILDFYKDKEIIKRGELAAQEKRKSFDSIANLQTHKKERKPLVLNTTKIHIDKIVISGYKNYTKAYVLGKLNLREGDSITYKILSNKVKYLAATQNFDKINFYVKTNDKKNTVFFEVEESQDKAMLGIGIHYDNLYQTGFLMNYNHKKLLRKNDMLSINLVLGDNIRFDATYFIDNGFYYSVGLKTRLNQFSTTAPFNGVSNVNEVNLNYSDATTQFFVQTVFERKFAIGLGTEFKAIHVNTETLSSIENKSQIIFDNSYYANTYAYLKFDSYDQKYFVNKGFYADLGFKWYLWSSDFADNFKPFYQGKGTIGFAKAINKNLTFQYTNDVGFSFGQPDSTVFDFYLGGINQNYINTFVPFYGYKFGELSNKSFVKSMFQLRYKFFQDNYISFIANYARLEDDLFKNISFLKGLKSGYALGYSYNSFAGPIEIKYTWSPETNRNYVVFNLGFWF